MAYDDLTDEEVDALLKTKAAASPGIGPSLPATESVSREEFPVREAALPGVAGIYGGTVETVIPENVRQDGRFSEFGGALIGSMLGTTIGFARGGPPGALKGGALAAEGGRRMALAGNEFLDWIDGKKDAQLGLGDPEIMASETIDSASMIFGDMATQGLQSKLAVPLQSFKEMFKGRAKMIGRMTSEQLKNVLDKMNIRGNPTLFGGPGSKRISVALTNLPSSARVMQESINNTFDDIVSHSDDMAEKIYSRSGLSKQSSGKKLKEGLDAWSATAKEKIDDVYKKIKGIDKKEYVDLPETRKALAAMKPKDLDKSSSAVFPSELKKYSADIGAEKVVGKRPAVVEMGKAKEFVDLPPKKVPRETKVNIITEEYTDPGGEVFGKYVDADLAKRRGAIERASGDQMKFKPKKKQMTLIDEVDEAQPPAEIDISEVSAYIPEESGTIIKPAGQLTWEDAANMRSAVGSKLRAPPLLRMGEKPTGQYAKVYAALTADLDNYAINKGKGTLLQIKRARQYVNAFHKRKALVNMIADSETAEAAFNAAVSGAKDGPSRINALRKAVRSVKGDEAGDAALTLADKKTINGDDIWDEFVATNFWKFGRKPAGQQGGVEAADFGINTFLKNYSNLKQSGALDAMFATAKLKKIKPDLDRFVNVLNEVKDLDKIINFSRTAEQSAAMKLIAGGFGAAPGYAAFGPIGLVIGPLATLGGPYGLSRMLTSKRGLRFLTTSIKEASKVKNSPSNHATRHFARMINKKLTDMVKEDPSMKQPAEAYLVEMEKLNSKMGQQ